VLSPLASPGHPGDEGDRRSYGTHEREGLQVDAIDTQAGLARRFGELTDHVALGGDDEDLLPGYPVIAGHRGQDLEIEYRIGQRYGNGLLRLKLDGRAKLLGVYHRKLHGAHDNLLVGDAERKSLAGETGRSSRSP